MFNYLGYGQGGIPYGSGPLPCGYPEDFIIPYDKFTGPGGKPPADFKGNYKEVLHQLLIALLEERDIDKYIYKERKTVRFMKLTSVGMKYSNHK